MKKNELYFMQEAVAMAELAYRAGEVPVGAVVVLNEEFIGKGSNSAITCCDPTAHAEIIALRQAGESITNYRLLGADVYVTLEPCLMCFAAMVHARIRTLIFGAADPKTGIFSTGAFDEIKKIFNHTITIKSGIIGEVSSALLKRFFKERRGAGAVERGGLENR